MEVWFLQNYIKLLDMHFNGFIALSLRVHPWDYGARWCRQQIVWLKLRDFERWIRELYYFIWVEKTTKWIVERF